jgi:hypothetical protein
MFTWENKSLKRESIKGVLMMRERKEKKRKKCNNKRMRNTLMKYKRRFLCTWCMGEKESFIKVLSSLRSSFVCGALEKISL